jgi:hypothetical protein
MNQLLEFAGIALDAIWSANLRPWRRRTAVPGGAVPSGGRCPCLRADVLLLGRKRLDIFQG